ncbi:MAG TPA: glycosyltransferase [Nevskiaceae bacterium]|nr:glycosyltransferase [Nevskiaceae bacterium]
MKFSVCIVTLPNYPHSEAFREVAETLHHGLQELGHESEITSRFDRTDRRQIVLGSNLLPRRSDRPAPGSVLYNLEQAGSGWMTPQLLELFRGYELWDYTAVNIAEFARLGITGVRQLPLGHAAAMSRIGPREEDVDVLMYGSFNERRKRIHDELQRRGVRVQQLFNVYGQARDAWIARARIVLNSHIYDAKIFEQVRVTYLLSNRRFVIAETGVDQAEEMQFAPGVVFARYEELVDRCTEYLGRPEERAAIAERGYELMTRRPVSAYLRPLIPDPLHGASRTITQDCP